MSSNIKKLIGLYPGSFDPLTLGHLDIIKRSIKIVDELIVAIGDNSDKKYKSFFTSEERLYCIKECIKNDSFLSSKNIKVEIFNGLLIDFAKKQNAQVIIRGLRALSDFDFEFNLASSNQVLNPNIESIFLMTSINKQLISSRIVKEIFMLGGDISKFVDSCIKRRMDFKKQYNHINIE